MGMESRAGWGQLALRAPLALTWLHTCARDDGPQFGEILAGSSELLLTVA